MNLTVIAGAINGIMSAWAQARCVVKVHVLQVSGECLISFSFLRRGNTSFATAEIRQSNSDNEGVLAAKAGYLIAGRGDDRGADSGPEAVLLGFRDVCPFGAHWNTSATRRESVIEGQDKGILSFSRKWTGACARGGKVAAAVLN